MKLKRASWTSFHPTSAGVRLLAGDQLRLAAEADAVVLCADFDTAPWRPTPGQHSAVEDACMRPKALSQLPDGLAAETREVEGCERVRSPRGLIRDPTPRLRWQSLGAEKHEVRVLRGKRPIWGWTLVRGTEKEMPPGFLEPTRPHWVQVRAYGEEVHVEASVPFTLIDDDQRKPIANGEGELLGQFPNDSTERRLALALYLAHQHLWDEALTLLDGGVLPELVSAASELLGGRLALGLGLRKGAAERFRKARELAQKSGDIESEAEALIGLAWAALRKEEKAERYEAAARLCEKLGDQEIRGSGGTYPCRGGCRLFPGREDARFRQ